MPKAVWLKKGNQTGINGSLKAALGSLYRANSSFFSEHFDKKCSQEPVEAGDMQE